MFWLQTLAVFMFINSVEGVFNQRKNRNDFISWMSQFRNIIGKEHYRFNPVTEFQKDALDFIESNRPHNSLRTVHTGITKRHRYRSCCDCCKTHLVSHFPVQFGDLTQFIPVNECQDTSGFSECSRCRCTMETRTFWILNETLSSGVAPQLSFVPIDLPTHCVHANAG